MNERLYLRLEAPFAACRPFVAGWYRPTASFITPSAVYGLLLNVAGIESRLWEHEKDHTGSVPASLTRNGLPTMRLALGLPKGESQPRVVSIFQQLHNYPVGTSGMPIEMSKGTKNNITPIRRELLCDIRVIVAVECDGDFAQRLRHGLRGELTERSYGLPFLGDNNYLLNRLEETHTTTARWYTRVDPSGRHLAGTARLTIRINREDMSKTVSDLFAPDATVKDEVPTNAWCAVAAG